MKLESLCVLGLIGFTGCAASAPSLSSLIDADDLVRQAEARTVVVSPHYSLYSPFDAAGTAQYVEMATREQDAVFALFELESDEPLVIWLRPITEAGGLEAKEGESLPIIDRAPDGFQGWAASRGITVRVAPEQRVHLDGGGTFSITFQSDSYERTMRHEIAHFATRAIGIAGADWLHEGIAHYVEYLEFQDGCLAAPAISLSRTEGELLPAGAMEHILSWRQSSKPNVEDATARVVAHSLIFFLLSDHSEPFPAALRRIAALSDEELIALEPSWRSWLESLASDPVNDAVPQQSADDSTALPGSSSAAGGFRPSP